MLCGQPCIPGNIIDEGLKLKDQDWVETWLHTTIFTGLSIQTDDQMID